MHIHVQTIKQNMHTIFVKKTLSYLNLSMKFKTKLKCESNKIITLDKNILDYIMKY